MNQGLSVYHIIAFSMGLLSYVKGGDVPGDIRSEIDAKKRPSASNKMLKPSFFSVLALLSTAISAQVVAPPASAVFDKDAVPEGSGHWYNEGLHLHRGFKTRPRIPHPARPRSSWITDWSPFHLSLRRSRRTCRSVTPISSATCFCVITFFFALLRASSRSRSVWFISSCPSSTLQAGPCQ
jgi:hypothetical protein